jgi:parallel beta-helix repeat protein
LEEAVAAYQNNPDVEFAELNYIVSIDLTPNDPLYPLHWSLNNIGQDYPASGKYNSPPGTDGSDVNAPEAWDITTGSYDVVVAVPDTGIDYTHRDLDDNIWVNEAELNGTAGVDDDGNGYIDDIYGYDFIHNNPFPNDDHGHGTHCAGIIAAEGDNALDIVGVCWDARIMAIKFLDAGGTGTETNAAKAIYYAVNNGADIISCSWGSNYYSNVEKVAVDYAHSQGVIVVASAGNENSTYPRYPAYYDNVIAVAATNSNDERAPFSNYGSRVDIAAPGVDILSLRAAGTSRGTIYDSYTTILSGTSMSCPHVVAVAALIISKHPDAYAQYVTAKLLQGTDEIPSSGMGRGRINAFKALRYGFEGVITLNRDFYLCDHIVRIELLDSDLIGAGTQQVILSTDGGDAETVLLTERSSAPGTFRGTISTITGTPVVEDGTVQVSHGQIITAIYYDVNDSIGDPNIATDTAGVDCYPPVILDVSLGVPGREPRVSVETDEPTTARVLCGLACGGPYNIIGVDSSLATSHTIKLIGVSPETDYFFIVKVTDVVNYVTVDDNAGQCYAFTTTGLGDDIYVPAQSSTMQEAVDNSWDNRTVWVADGIYAGPDNRDIDFRARPITVKSEDGPENCIIDCNGIGHGFYFHNREGPLSVLSGLTITNAAGAHAGIYCDDRTEPIISNCILVANRGTGIYCDHESRPAIANCTIVGNRSSGIRTWGIESAAIANCTIVENGADGIYSPYGRPTVINCISWANNGNAIYGAGPYVTYSNIEGGYTGEGNTDTDPCFVSMAYWVDVNDPNIIVDPEDPNANAVWVVGDYYLLPDSPCIDAGDPDFVPEPNETAIDGLPRVMNGKVDMGAYEFNHIPDVPVAATVRFKPQMLNCNSKVKWLKANFVLPNGFWPVDVDVHSPAVARPIGLGSEDEIESEYIKVVGNEHGSLRVEAAFDRQTFCSMLTDAGGGSLEVTVVGFFITGQYFYGTNTVRMINLR